MDQGVGAGLVAFLGAELRPGVEVVMDAVGFPSRLARTDLVVTGEGDLDAQSLRGKVPAGVIRRARQAGTEALVLCGGAEVRPEGIRVESLLERFGEEPAMHETSARLADLAATVTAER